MIILLYNLSLPFVFLLFLPGIVIKFIKRGGHKSTYLERIGFFSKHVKRQLKGLSAPIWVHAVSVGETQIAVNFIKQWEKNDPKTTFLLSTTTTTGQALARKNAPENVVVIFKYFCC